MSQTNPLRWGVLGAGNIASQFCRDLIGAERCTVTAIGSRTQQRADEFAAQNNIPAAHSDYKAVLHDKRVDAVYVALPNSLHHEWTLRALEAGKHVLCEKPLAGNVEQAREMFDAAKAHNRVLVEAFMYRSHPMTRTIMKQINDGVIGRVRLVRTSFCFRTWNIEQNTRFNATLQGGALMDIGCYCIDLAQWIAGGEPIDVHCFGHVHESGVDDYAGAVLHFKDDLVATMTCALSVQADNTVSICGDDGYIEIPVPWKPPIKGASFTVGHSIPPKMDQGLADTARRVKPREMFYVDAPKPLYALEADDFAATVHDGAPPSVSRESSLATMRTLDICRKQLGLSF